MIGCGCYLLNEKIRINSEDMYKKAKMSGNIHNIARMDLPYMYTCVLEKHAYNVIMWPELQMGSYTCIQFFNFEEV